MDAIVVQGFEDLKNFEAMIAIFGNDGGVELQAVLEIFNLGHGVFLQGLRVGRFRVVGPNRRFAQETKF